MACFSDATKHKCSKFVMVVGIVLVILGILTLAYGYAQFSGQSFENEYAEMDFTSGLAMGTLAAGLFTAIVGICGLLTAKFKKPFFAAPFMICSFIFFIVCLIIGGMSLAPSDDVTEAKEVACTKTIKVDGSEIQLEKYASEQYAEFIGNVMCTSECPCDTTAFNAGGYNTLNSTYLSSFGRNADGSLPLVTADTDGVKTFEECYTKLKANQDAGTGQFAQKAEAFTAFFEGGGYDMFEQLEKDYECASICKTPLFYIATDLSVGPPLTDCATESIKNLSGNMGVGAVAVFTGLVLLFAFFGSIPLCTGFSKKGDE